MQFKINSLYQDINTRALLALVTINGVTSQQLYNCLPKHLVRQDDEWICAILGNNRAARRSR